MKHLIQRTELRLHFTLWQDGELLWQSWTLIDQIYALSCICKGSVIVPWYEPQCLTDWDMEYWDPFCTSLEEVFSFTLPLCEVPWDNWCLNIPSLSYFLTWSNLGMGSYSWEEQALTGDFRLRVAIEHKIPSGSFERCLDGFSHLDQEFSLWYSFLTNMHSELSFF